MTVEPERTVRYLPLYQEYAGQLSDEMPDPPWTDPVGWSTALRQTADLIEPDAIVVAGVEPVLADLDAATDTDLTNPRFEDSVGSASEAYLETVRILAEVRQEPVFVLLPGPVTICTEYFDEAWAGIIEGDEFVALDAVHGASQLLTDRVRAVGGSIAGVVLDEPLLGITLDDGLSFEDVVLETGAIFNVAEHHGLPVFGRFLEACHETVTPRGDEYHALVFDQLSLDTLDRIDASSWRIGGSFSTKVWRSTDAEFEALVTEYLRSLPEDFVLMPELPPAVPPERVRQFRELLDSVAATESR